jgi:hypothetical protein
MTWALQWQPQGSSLVYVTPNWSTQPYIIFLIQLWQADDLSYPKLPQGLPNHVPFHPIWGNDPTKSINKDTIINGGLFKYVEFWKMGM